MSACPDPDTLALLEYVAACRRPRHRVAEPVTAPRLRLPPAATPEERRARNRERQRLRRLDPMVRARERAYARHYHELHRERRLQQMRAYALRRKTQDAQPHRKEDTSHGQESDQCP